MRFHIITIFPDILNSYFSKGMLRIAQEKKIIKIKAHDLRQFAVDKHGTVDDKPYGGGPGQVLMVEPVCKALMALGAKNKRQKTKKGLKNKEKRIKIILLSAKGKTWNQQMAKRFSKLDEIIFVCPRYEGHDERIKKFVDEEISIGDYVLTGGELGAAVIIDSITRLLPGVLGKRESLTEESHSAPGYLEYPQYTRPESYSRLQSGLLPRAQTPSQLQSRNLAKAQRPQLLRVPKVLLSGHHKKIEEWRKKHSKIK